MRRSAYVTDRSLCPTRLPSGWALLAPLFVTTTTPSAHWRFKTLAMTTLAILCCSTVVHASQRNSSGSTSAPRDLKEWTFAQRPFLEVGQRSNPQWNVTKIVAAFELSNRSILIASAEHCEFLLFDSAASFQARFGRCGQSPGEFATISSVHLLRGDSIAVFDQRSRRVTVLDARGRVGEAIEIQDLPDSLNIVVAGFAGVLDDGFLVLLGYGRDYIAQGVARGDLHVLIFDRQGRFRRRIRSVPGNEILFANVGGAGVALLTPLFARKTSVRLNSDKLLLNDNELFLAEGLDSRGARLFTAALPITGQPVSRRLVRRAVETMSAGRKLPHEVEVALTSNVPRTTPAVAQMEVDRTGHLWLRQYDVGASGNWWVFDQHGHPVAKAQWPHDAAIFAIGETVVVAVRNDRAGSAVFLFRLNR